MKRAVEMLTEEQRQRLAIHVDLLQLWPREVEELARAMLTSYADEVHWCYARAARGDDGSPE